MSPPGRDFRSSGRRPVPPRGRGRAHLRNLGAGKFTGAAAGSRRPAGPGSACPASPTRAGSSRPRASRPHSPRPPRAQGYCRRHESTSPSSGPAWPSPPSSSSTNLFSSYSSTSTFRKRADDTVFFDIPDRDATLASPRRCLSLGEPCPARLTSLFRSGASPAAAACSLLGLRASQRGFLLGLQRSFSPPLRLCVRRGARAREGARGTPRARAEPLRKRGGAGGRGGGGGRTESWLRRRGDAIGRRGASRDARGVPIETLFCGPALRRGERGFGLEAMGTPGAWPGLLLPPPPLVPAACCWGPV